MKKIFALLLALVLLCAAAFAEEFSPLQNGSSGEDVVKMQEQLIILGFLTGTADGFFGPITENAVKAFQAKNGLEENGVLDQDGLARLNSINAKGASDDYEYRNLLYFSADPVYAGPGNPSSYVEGVWRDASGGTGTREVIDLDSPIAGISKGFHIIGTTDCTAPTDVGIDGLSLNFGECYTLSCFAKGNGKIHLQHGKTSWPSKAYAVSENWQQYSYTFTVGIDDGCTAEDPFTNVYFGVVGGMDSDILICGMKLEKVQIRPTDWTANPADSVKTRTLPSDDSAE